MKRTIVTLLIFCFVCTILTGCGNSDNTNTPAPTQTQPQEKEETPSVEQPQENTEQTDIAVNSDKIDNNANQGEIALCDRYKAFSNANDEFEQYAFKKSEDKTINFSKVSGISNLKSITYLMPLVLIGTSVQMYGTFDEAMETTFLQSGWAKDAKLTVNGEGSYTLTGTLNESAAVADIDYDFTKDTLRLVTKQDGALVYMFEYAKTVDGYAAQFYFEHATHFERSEAVLEFCAYKTIFSGENGASACFEGVEEPASILEGVPTRDELISGATHYFTLEDGVFSGKISGETF